MRRSHWLEVFQSVTVAMEVTETGKKHLNHTENWNCGIPEVKL